MSIWLGHRMPRYLVKHYPGCVCEGLSGWDWHLNWQSHWSRLWVSLVQSAEDLNRAKMLTFSPLKGNSPCLTFELGGLFQMLDSETSALFLGLKSTNFQTGTYTVVFPSSQAFAFRMELDIDSPVCWLQTLGLLNPHNHMLQFLETKYLYLLLLLFLWRFLTDAIM